MSILDQKSQVMGNISSLNVLTEGLPKLKKGNSFSSINNSGNATDFLIDLVRSLVGYNDLKRNITDVITRKLPQIELEIKNSLKKDLKDLVSCSVNPGIPTWFKSGGSGVTLKLSDIDFFDITKVDPKSPFGFLIYSDQQTGLNSTDFNTFLYSNIELNRDSYSPNGGSYSTWGSSTINEDIIDIRFSPIGTTQNNIVNFKTNSNYDNKTLTELNNNFIDSINLFGSPNSIDSGKILAAIVDNLFGTVSVNIGKTKKQLKKEAEINEVLKCILNADDSDVIDDSFFTFSNEQIKMIELQVKNKSKGIGILETCGNTPASVPIEILLESNEEINDSINTTTGTTSPEEAQVNAVDKAIDNIANAQTENVADVDIPTIKVNFILELIKRFMQSIISIILSPKLITLYAINHQIIYGQGSSYDGPIDFMKKNKTLITRISKTVLEIIIRMLLALALKYITRKVSEKIAGDNIEKGKNYIAQILSLIGISPAIIRQIQGLGALIV
jgi:hypothetical protein